MLYALSFETPPKLMAKYVWLVDSLDDSLDDSLVDSLALITDMQGSDCGIIKV